MHTVPSPCTGVCRIEPATGWCAGCARSLDEIADWPMLSSREKLELKARLAARLAPDTETRQRPPA